MNKGKKTVLKVSGGEHPGKRAESDDLRLTSTNG